MSGIDRERILELLESVRDPEIPALSVVDMGIVRDVAPDGEGWRIDITPTYSGCPAMEMIARDIVATLAAAGVPSPRVRTVVSPPWTTDDMTPRAREALAASGIAPPPAPLRAEESGRSEPERVGCPYCGEHRTRLVSAFGTTACKALYRCDACGQPFDLFKRH